MAVFGIGCQTMFHVSYDWVYAREYKKTFQRLTKHALTPNEFEIFFPSKNVSKTIRLVIMDEIHKETPATHYSIFSLPAIKETRLS